MQGWILFICKGILYQGGDGLSAPVPQTQVGMLANLKVQRETWIRMAVVAV